MKATIDAHCVLHIMPCDTVDVIALKYWAKEFVTHGVKLIEIDDLSGAALSMPEPYPAIVTV
jgi:hypothetical protein